MFKPHPWADGDSQRFFEACYEGTFRQAVAAYCRHRRMGARRFADAALGKGGLQFIRPYRGRSIRLATADKALRFMGEPRFGPLFRREVEAFLAVTGMKAYLLGEMAVGDPSFVTRLRKGASAQLSTVDRVHRWIGVNSSRAQRAEIGAMALRGKAFRFVGGGDSGPGASLASFGESVAEEEPELLTTTQTAARVGLSPRTLERFRVTGQGPRFLKLGCRVRYAREDIEDWLKGCVRRSTSDDGGDRGGSGQTA